MDWGTPTLRILSWNVNGIRAREKQGLVDAIEEMDPDIFFLQEVRAKPDQLSTETKDFLSHYDWAISEHSKAGYAGVLGAYSKKLKTKFGKFPVFKEGSELGRECILSSLDLTLVGVYSPNSGRDLEKIENRLKWENDLKEFVTAQAGEIIICGDMNVAPDKIDSNVFSKAGTSKEERGAFADLKKEGKLIDVFRHLEPYKQQFTWFSNTYDSRKVNKGMRLDHFLVSEPLLNKIEQIQIVQKPSCICGSDHNPVMIDLIMEV